MKRFVPAVIAVLFFFLPTLAAAQSPAPALDHPILRATLANGMHVIMLPNRLAPVVTSAIFYNVGFDDDTLPGIAHATEHMLFRGTTNVSAGQFADIATRAGAQYNALTSNEYTLYYFKVPAAYTGVALHLEADRMRNAQISDAAWKTERGAIQQEIRAQLSIPGYAIGMKLRETFFKGMPFATASGGTIASFEKMTATDIRAFYRKWYQPSNATIVIAGDIDAAKTLADVHAQFDAISKSASPTHASFVVPVLASASITDSMDFPMGFAALAYRLPGQKDADYAAAQVLTEALRNGRGALTDLSAEGKILAAIDIAAAFPEVGASFFVAIPSPGAPPSAALTLIGGVLESYRTNGIPADLVEAAKTSILSQQAYRQASISGLAFEWVESALIGASPDDVFAAVQKVTKADVDRVLRTYFSQGHQISVVILPKPTTQIAKVDPSAGIENVTYRPSVHERLPRWAQAALSAPLKVPADDKSTFEIKLPNGIHLVVRRESTSPTIVLDGYIRTDSQLYEPTGKDGVSLILDGLMGWGTKTYDRKAYQAQLDLIAADELLGTGFGLKVQSKDFERGMELLADGMLHPSFAAADFAVVKSKMLQSVTATNKLPQTKADLAQRLALYAPGDPRRRDVTAQTIAAIGLADVLKYYRFAYRPDETSIAIVGDVSPEQAQRVVEKYFGTWGAIGAAPSFRYPHIKAASTKSQTVTVKSATSQQSEVTLKQIFTMTRGDADYVPMLLANTILSGEGTGSMLFENLRTKFGYVYNVDSEFSVRRSEAEFTISYSSAPKDVNKANAAAVAIIRNLQTKPLPSVELQRAKALLLAQRVLPLDSYDGVASDILSGAADGYFNRSESSFWAALLHTTPGQLQHAMQRINTHRFLRVILAPGK
jgi:zinc protease